MPLNFEWDEKKAKTNAVKHGVSFEDAATVFADPLSLTIPDPVHPQAEKRFIILGESHAGVLLVVEHTERGDNLRSSAPDGRAAGNKKTMKKVTSKTAAPAMRKEYDFTAGVRGKYARRYAQGTNLVLLEPDVAKAFPSAASVNESLRALAASSADGKNR